MSLLGEPGSSAPAGRLDAGAGSQIGCGGRLLTPGGRHLGCAFLGSAAPGLALPAWLRARDGASRPGTARTWLPRAALETCGPSRCRGPARSLRALPASWGRGGGRGVRRPGAPSRINTVVGGHPKTGKAPPRLAAFHSGGATSAGSGPASPCRVLRQRGRGRAWRAWGSVGTLGRRGSSPKTPGSAGEDGEGLPTGRGLPSGAGGAVLQESGVWLLFAPRLASGQEDNEPLRELRVPLCRVTELDKASYCRLRSLLQP